VQFRWVIRAKRVADEFTSGLFVVFTIIIIVAKTEEDFARVANVFSRRKPDRGIVFFDFSPISSKVFLILRSRG